MKAISHSDLITKIRNCEGEVLARIEGEEFCCNPEHETLVNLGLAEPKVDELDEGTTDDPDLAEARQMASAGDPLVDVDAHAGDTDADGQPNPSAGGPADNPSAGGETPADYA